MIGVSLSTVIDVCNDLTDALGRIHTSHGTLHDLKAALLQQISTTSFRVHIVFAAAQAYGAASRPQQK